MAGSTTDLVRQYLQEIGWVELLSTEPERVRARLVQRRQTQLVQQQDDSAASEAWARRTKELLDLVQEGTLGLERGWSALIPAVASASAPRPAGGSVRGQSGDCPPEPHDPAAGG